MDRGWLFLIGAAVPLVMAVGLAVIVVLLVRLGRERDELVGYGSRLAIRKEELDEYEARLRQLTSGVEDDLRRSEQNRKAARALLVTTYDQVAALRAEHVRRGFLPNKNKGENNEM